MRLWKFECQKLWKNRLVCGLILGCFFLNVVFLLQRTKSYDESARCFPGTVKAIYQELEALAEEEKMDWLEEQLSRIEQQGGAQDMEWVEQTDMLERRNALESVLENVRKTVEYEEYLNGIEKQAKRLTVSSLFSQADAFSRRNAEQTAKVYQPLRRQKLKAENSQGVLLAVRSGTTDLFLAALVILLVYFFICVEREEGTMAFVRCIRYGAAPLGKTKISVIFAGSLLGAFFLYMSNFAVAGAVYGFGSMERGIQSLEGYTASPWKLTVGGYLVLFLLWKLLAVAVLAACAVWIALHGKSILQTSLLLLGVAGIEYALYAGLAPHSWLDILKQCNLFSFMRTEQFFQSYETINLFQYPVPSVLLCGTMSAVLIGGLVLHSIVSYERVSQAEYAQRKRKKRLFGKWRKRQKAHSLLYYEAYKILWTGKAGILIVLFLVVQFQSYSSARGWFTLDELYYKNYIRQMEGNVTEEKLDFIEEEGRRIEKLEEERLTLSANAEGLDASKLQKKQLSLERQLLCSTAYEQVKAQAERIGRNGIFLDETGYLYLLDQKQQVYQLGKLLILWILAFYSVFIMEEISRMPTVWNSITDGKKKIWKRKWLLLVACILFVTAASDFLLVFFRMKIQGIGTLNVPLRYLPGFEGFKWFSVLGYFILSWAWKAGVGILACKMIERISKRAGSATAVLLGAGGIAGIFYLCICIFPGMI